MGRKRLHTKKSDRARDGKVEGVAQVKKATVRRHFVPALIQHYRRSVMPELARLLPIARRRNRPQTPFKILVLGRKELAKSIPPKDLGGACKNVSAPKISSTPPGPRNDSAPPRPKAVKSLQKVGKWRVALASKHAQIVVDVQNESVLGDSRLKDPTAVHQNEGDGEVDVLRHPRLASKNTKKHPLHNWGGIAGTDNLVQCGGGFTGCGPCTRSRSGRTGSAARSLSGATGARLNAESLATGDAKDSKERQTGTALRSLRKHEANFNYNSAYPTPRLDTELQATSLPGRKRRRLTQRTGDSNLLNENAGTTNACLRSSTNAAVGGGEGRHEVCASQPGAPQRRHRSRRKRVAKRRCSQAAPFENVEAAHTNVVQTSPHAAPIQPQTTLPCFLHWPNDPTRPFSMPAIAFEPADLRLGFDGIMEWPCVVANGAADSPNCVSQIDEEPRFFLCGGLPDPPRSPPWSRKPTSSDGEDHPDALPQSSPDKGAEVLRVAASSGATSQCLERSSDEQSAVYTASSLAAIDGSGTLSETAEERLQKQAQRQSSRMQKVDTTVHPTDTTEGGAAQDEEDDDWVFTPPDPERATAIVKYMGDTIRRLIATTQAVQRRTDMYNKICQRLFCINEPCRHAWQRKTTENVGDCMPPGWSGKASKQRSPVSSGPPEHDGQANVITDMHGHLDGYIRSQSYTGAPEELYFAASTIQGERTPAQAAAVFSSVDLQYPGYLADLELRLLRNPAFENDEFAQLCLQLVKKYGKDNI